jgi:PST family polysaccharide transporter
MNAITFSCALLITFCSGFIIKTCYGESFIDAAPILSIHIWTGVFYFLGMAGSRFYIIENLQRLHFRRTFFGAILNIALNFILIPRYGGVGAAIGILITQFFVSYFVEIFSQKTRVLFILKSKSFLLFKN